MSKPSSHVPNPPLPFTPVCVRTRRDGWTVERQRAFVAALCQHRSPDRAARLVGMSRESAYRLRGRPDAASFAAAWDAALHVPRCEVSGTGSLWDRAVNMQERPIIYAGKQVGTRIGPDDKALIKLAKRFNRLVPLFPR